ncbi:MAG: hypothetical protein AAFZ15_14645 [Bacteroidota bacterium]
MKNENMLFLTKSLFILFFCFFAFTLTAQVGPVATGSNGDYCECLEGIQGPDEYCPPLPCPPSGNNGGGPTNNNGGPTGTPTPTGGNNTGGTNTEFYDSMIESVFCMMFPHMCP